jgi:uncharacterized protein (AIM24 family)
MKKIIVTPEGTIEVELTAEEIAQKEQDAIKAEQERIEFNNKIEQEKANKQSALNKLKALGLNDAEIKSIIG